MAVARAGFLRECVHTKVSVATSSTQLLPTNTSRRLAIFQNIGDTDVDLKFGVAAVAGEGIRLYANGGSYTSNEASGTLDERVVNAIHGGAGIKDVLVTEA